MSGGLCYGGLSQTLNETDRRIRCGRWPSIRTKALSSDTSPLRCFSHRVVARELEDKELWVSHGVWPTPSLRVCFWSGHHSCGVPEMGQFGPQFLPGFSYADHFPLLSSSLLVPLTSAILHSKCNVGSVRHCCGRCRVLTLAMGATDTEPGGKAKKKLIGTLFD